MAKEKMNFKTFVDTCVYKHFQMNKCVNEKNKGYRLIGSCSEKDCPIYKKEEIAIEE